MKQEAEDRLRETAQALAEDSSNLLDVLNTLNFHSPQEAADDIRDSAGETIKDMKKRVRFFHQGLIGELGIRGVRRELAAELSDMNEFLDILRHCQGDPRSFRNLLDVLIPIIRLLEKWSGDGPEIPA